MNRGRLAAAAARAWVKASVNGGNLPSGDR